MVQRRGFHGFFILMDMKCKDSHLLLNVVKYMRTLASHEHVTTYTLSSQCDWVSYNNTKSICFNDFMILGSLHIFDSGPDNLIQWLKADPEKAGKVV